MMTHLSLLGVAWPVNASAAALTMNNGVLQIIDGIAFILMGFSQLLLLVFPDPMFRRRFNWMPAVIPALTVIAVGGIILDTGTSGFKKWSYQVR